MPYEVTADERAAIVRVRVWGSASRQEHLAARREAALLCQARGYLRILVDLRELQTAGEVSTSGCFRFGTSFREDGVPTACRIATLLPHDAQARRDTEFATQVGTNRGVLTRCFEDVADAEAWLAVPIPTRAGGP
ncbi:MAG: hypothetical protein GF330_14510 [Candidatus Eisenbacteria bacterium]|nr:hypothetical protein [Candidatus Eisenbacteria bacterium]